MSSFVPFADLPSLFETQHQLPVHKVNLRVRVLPQQSPHLVLRQDNHVKIRGLREQEWDLGVEDRGQHPFSSIR